MKIGILGGGQLARMLALAAYPLGLTTLCYEPQAHSSASFVTAVHNGSWDDSAALQDFAHAVDVITYETENIAAEIALQLQQYKPLYPSVEVLITAQDRYLEKNLFRQLDIPTPAFMVVNSLAELTAAVATIGLPAVLKTRRFGYDGKGQYVLHRPEDAATAWTTIGEQAAILEAWVPFDAEVSLIAVRDLQQQIRFYPLSLNYHQQGILRLTQAPCDNLSWQQQAQSHLKRLLNHFNYVGVLAVEFFVVKDQLLANEMAPRVHNSGHWTLNGAATSQFENHIRAICGLPLGETTPLKHSAMINCIGTEPPLADVLAIPGTHYHSYQKSPRPARKVAHINWQGDLAKRELAIKQLESLIK